MLVRKKKKPEKTDVLVRFAIVGLDLYFLIVWYLNVTLPLGSKF